MKAQHRRRQSHSGVVRDNVRPLRVSSLASDCQSQGSVTDQLHPSIQVPFWDVISNASRMCRFMKQGTLPGIVTSRVLTPSEGLLRVHVNIIAWNQPQRQCIEPRLHRMGKVRGATSWLPRVKFRAGGSRRDFPDSLFPPTDFLPCKLSESSANRAKGIVESSVILPTLPKLRSSLSLRMQG